MTPSREATDDTLRVGSRSALFILVAYFLSGVTSVAYEVLWARMVSLQFGVSIFGVVVTVTAFMAGLGVGSLFAARLIARISRPLLVFAVLEVCIAAWALLTPLMLSAGSDWLGARSGSASLLTWYAIQSAMVFTVLFVPALAMGAAFPAVLQSLHPEKLSLGRIYGLNTIGGGCGALLPLILLPSMGWATSLQVVVAAGVGVALLAAVLDLWRAKFSESTKTVDYRAALVRPGFATLVAYGGLGAAALMLEIGWTRLFGMILLRTEYVLAILLAVFLLGTGIGSLFARAKLVAHWLSWFPVLAGACALASLWGLVPLANWADHQQPNSLGSALFQQGLAIAILTFPTTLLLGAWLPFLTQHVGGGRAVAGAWLYGANSVGAAAGSMLAGFVLIPKAGTTGTLVVAALLLFVCGMRWSASRVAWLALPVLLLVGASLWSFPPVNRLLPVTLSDVRDLSVYEDAVSITHVVEQPDGQRLLLADLRRMDASTDPTAVAAQQNQARLPLLLHPAPRSVLFLGLGTGITAAGALPFPDVSGVAVELSRGAISAAGNWFAPANGAVTQKMRIVHDDARRFLLTDGGQYDVIVGDLFHPDLVGRGNLLSLQHFSRVRQRLAPGGLFVQWLALNQFDMYSLQVILRTFRSVFPEAVLFLDGMRVALVGARDVWQGGVATANNLARLSSDGQDEATGGEGEWTWLGRYWGPISVADGPLQDDRWPQIEFRLPAVRYSSSAQLGLAALLDNMLRGRPSVEAAAAQLGLSQTQFSAFERAYIATEQAVRSWSAGLRSESAQAQRLLRFAYEANPKDRWIGFNLADQIWAAYPQALQRREDPRRILDAVLAIRPDHVDALKALWRLELDASHAQEAERLRQRIRQLSPLDNEVPQAGG